MSSWGACADATSGTETTMTPARPIAPMTTPMSMRDPARPCRRTSPLPLSGRPRTTQQPNGRSSTTGRAAAPKAACRCSYRSGVRGSPRPLRLEADGAGHAGAAQAAVAHRVLVEVLLVVALGVPEVGGVGDLGGGRRVARCGK